jgi:hypothetical protein
MDNLTIRASAAYQIAADVFSFLTRSSTIEVLQQLESTTEARTVVEFVTTNVNRAQTVKSYLS